MTRTTERPFMSNVYASPLPMVTATPSHRRPDVLVLAEHICRIVFVFQLHQAECLPRNSIGGSDSLADCNPTPYSLRSSLAPAIGGA